MIARHPESAINYIGTVVSSVCARRSNRNNNDLVLVPQTDGARIGEVQPNSIICCDVRFESRVRLIKLTPRSLIIRFGVCRACERASARVCPATSNIINNRALGVRQGSQPASQPAVLLCSIFLALICSVPFVHKRYTC